MTADLAATLQRLLGTTYRLESELLGGGMSRVFVAVEPALRRRVVVKVLPPDLVSAASLARFRHEIEVTARLQHPHILPIVTAGSGDGLSWYVAPFIDGQSLHDRLARDGHLARDEALLYVGEVAEAVAFAHAHGVVHRDIKPANVLLHEGHAVLADFGVARALLGEDAAGGITGIETHAALAAYLPPDKPGGEGADCWALGALAHELLTGQAPTLPVTTRGVLAKLGGAGAADRAIAELVATALAVDPAARFANAASFRDALARVRALAGGSGAARSWRLAAFAVGGIAVLFGGLSWVYTRVRDEVGAERPIAVVVEEAGAGAVVLRDAMEAALREWRGVRVAAARESRGVQRLVVRRATDGVSLSARLDGSNGRQIALVEHIAASSAAWENDAVRALAREAVSRLLRDAASPFGWKAPSATLSLTAWREYDAALLHLERAELLEAQQGFRRALRAEPSHRAAQTRLAVALLAAADSTRRGEAELLLREAGSRAGGPFLTADSLRWAGWLAIVERRHASACAAFEEIIRREPEAWDGWLGLGECRMRDDRVVASRASPTGQSFLAGYHGAALAYERAEALARSRAPLAVYRGLVRTLPAILTRGRVGRAEGDGKMYFALPRLRHDTLAHFPESMANTGWDSTSRRAVVSSRARLHAIALRRYRAAPDDASAATFLAEILEQQGIIDRPRSDGFAALALVRQRRASDPSSALGNAWSEARLLLKVGALSEALEIADRTLRSAQPRSSSDESLVALFAALAGDTTRLRSALQQIAALDSRMMRDRAGRALDLPVPVLIERARFLAPALLGLCSEDVHLGRARIERAIAVHIADPAARDGARDALGSEAAGVASPCQYLASPANGWLSFPARVGAAAASGDSVRARELIRTADSSSFFLPGERSWETEYATVWALARLGDTTSAYATAARALSGAANHAIESMDRLEEIAALRRLIVLARRLVVALPGADRGDWWLQAAPSFAPVHRER